MSESEISSWENEREIYEYIGKFAIEFEQVCKAMETCIRTILDVNGLHNPKIHEVLLAGYTAAPLRSLTQNLVGEILVPKGTDKDSCSKLFNRIQKLIESRNELLHSKLFLLPKSFLLTIGLDEEIRLSGEKLRSTQNGASSIDRCFTKPEIEQLLNECIELRLALALVYRCAMKIRTLAECFTVSNDKLVCNWEMLRPIDARWDSQIAISDIFKPDDRNISYVMNGKPIGLDYFLRNVGIVKVSNKVPDSIVVQIEALKRLIIYTYYCYDFHPIAQLYSFSIIEHALKIRCKRNQGGLKNLIEMAVKEGLIVDSGFKYFALSGANTSGYCKILIENISHMRNALAHGTTTLHPMTILNLAVCADIVNQLFEEKPL